jgi:predicted metallopeptidase
MASVYRTAQAVKEVAEEIIATDRDDLDGVPIVYLFISPTPQSNGRNVWGRARRITGLNAVLAALDSFDGIDRPQPAEPFYVIEISEEIWEALDEPRRRALVDHELCHLRPIEEDDGTKTLKMRGHDFEEFIGVLRRHGLWTTAADAASKAVAEQLALELDRTLDEITGQSGGGGGADR